MSDEDGAGGGHHDPAQEARGTDRHVEATGDAPATADRRRTGCSGSSASTSSTIGRSRNVNPVPITSPKPLNNTTRMGADHEELDPGQVDPGRDDRQHCRRRARRGWPGRPLGPDAGRLHGGRPRRLRVAPIAPSPTQPAPSGTPRGADADEGPDGRQRRCHPEHEQAVRPGEAQQRGGDGNAEGQEHPTITISATRPSVTG